MSSAKRPTVVEYDLHLSAIAISPATIVAIQAMGFVRDEFANNTRCVASEYHGTFRGDRPLPDDGLWAEVSNLLESDPNFVGGLEEESTQSHHEYWLRGGSATPMPRALPTIDLQGLGTGKHKACDIHIGVTIGSSTPEAIAYVDALGAASFEKPAPEGVRRVYTITCETFEDGERVFLTLCRQLERVPGLSGKLKLEHTTRFFRKPADAHTLPLTNSVSVDRWLARVEMHDGAVGHQPAVSTEVGAPR